MKLQTLAVGLLLLCTFTLKLVNGQISWVNTGTSENVCEAHDITSSVYTISATGSPTIVYSILNEDSVPFTMCSNPSTDGNVCLKQSLDYEVVKTYSVTEAAQVQGDSSTQKTRTRTVRVIDDNDNDPLFEGIPFIYYYREFYDGQPAGVNIANISASDVDNGFAGVVDITLQDDADGWFKLTNKGTHYELYIEKPLDFETSQIHTGVITASDRGDTDGGCGGVDVARSSTQNIYLNVRDAPDTKPFFLSQQYVSNVKENSDMLDSALVVQAQDGDFDMKWEIKYDLTGADDLFKIDENDGTISIIDATKIDRESPDAQNGYYELTVTAKEIDPGTGEYSEYPGAESATTTVIINVEDVNDNNPKFYSDPDYKMEETNFVVNISENSNTIPEFRIYVKDIDQPDNAEFSLSVTGEDASYFSLSQSDVVSQAILTLFIEENPDYEKKNVLTFKIEADEKDTVSSASVTVNLIDQNDNFPEFELYNDTVSVPEHSPEGKNVALVKATDKDSEEYGPISYRLLPADSGFNIADDGTVYVSDGNLDREVRGQFYLTVIAEDGGDLVQTTQLTVNLEDINDHEPVFLQSQYLINWDENDDNLSPVTVQATDRDEAGNVNSELNVFVNDGAANYNITQTANDGSVVADITPKYELDAENTNGVCSNGVIQYSFQIGVTDQGVPPKTSNADVLVFLRDINDHTPYFMKSLYDGEVPEESASDTIIADVLAKDDDKCSPNNDITYTVADAFSDKFLMRASDDGTWSLRVRDQSLDRNVQDVYDVIVYAVDGGQPRRTGNTTVKVTITDINNKFPFFDETASDSDIEVIETAAIGTVIGKVVATDLDEDSLLEYSVLRVLCESSTVDDYDCSEWFEVRTQDQEGIIQVKNELDREKVQTVSFTVQVNDTQANKPKVQTAERTITITILDYNDNPPKFSNPDISFTVVEEGNGTVIGAITATDEDLAQTITFSTYSKYIKITDTGEISVGGRIDREGDPGDNFTAVIFATDDGAPSLTSNITVLFQVTDSNDNDPEFNVTSVTCEVYENLPKNTSVCQYIAKDKDIGNNGRISYSLNPSNNFIVETTTGWIRTFQTFDQETMSSYQLKLEAKDDAGELSRIQEIDVTINILDVDDNDPNYIDFALQELAIIEENKEIKTVGFIKEANDADTKENQKNSYFLVYKQDTDPERKFSLNQTTRELFATVNLDREANNSYMLYVLTTKNESIMDDNYDSHDPSIILPVQVIVMDINDNAPKFSRSSYTTDLLFSANYDENDIVEVVPATDPDVGENSTLTYSIASETYYPPGGLTAEQGQPTENFKISNVQGNGQIQLIAASFSSTVEVGGLFRLDIQVKDGGGLDGEATVDIKIFDETETVILISRLSVEYLNNHRSELELALEEALDADVVIDSIQPHQEQNQGNAVPVARAVVTETTASPVSTLTDVYFHATEWNETALIPADQIVAELDTVENNQLLVDYAVVSVTTSEVGNQEQVSETDLLKVALVAVSGIMIVLLVVFTIAFVCMRKKYKRKIKAAKASGEGAKYMEEQMATAGDMNIPGTNKNAAGESTLYLEDQKGYINMALYEDNNSIDDNEVDSQDSAISEDHQGSQQMEDDLGDVEIDFEPDIGMSGDPGDDFSVDNGMENLQKALNSRMGGGDIMFDSEFGEPGNTAM